MYKIIRKNADKIIFILPAFIGISGYFLMDITIYKMIFILLFIITTLFVLKNNDSKEVFNYFLLGIMFLMPTLIPKKEVATLTSSKIEYIYLSSLVITLIYFVKNREVKQKSKTTIEEYIICIYLFIIILSTINSSSIFQALIGVNNRFEGFATLSCYVLIFIIASKYYVFREKHLTFMIISTLLICFYGISQYYGFDPFRPLIGSGDRYSINSTIGNRNFLGSYITLFLPINIFLFSYTKKLRYFLTSGVLFSTLLLTFTRSSWVAFIVYIVVIGIYIIKYNLGRKRFIYICISFSIILVSLNYVESNRILGRFSTINSNIQDMYLQNENLDKVGSNRMFIWRRAVKLIPERPLLGSGSDTFNIVFMDRFGEELKESWGGDIIVDKAHNEYLQIAVTTGIPSLICYLLLIFYIAFKGLKSVKNNIYIIPVGCAVLGYLTQAFFNISMIAVAPIYWCMLGILVNFYKKDSNALKKVG